MENDTTASLAVVNATFKKISRLLDDAAVARLSVIQLQRLFDALPNLYKMWGVNYQDKLRETLLIKAARVGRLDLVKYLLAQNADPFIINWQGHSAIKVARQHHHHQIVRELTYAIVSLTQQSKMIRQFVYQDSVEEVPEEKKQSLFAFSLPPQVPERFETDSVASDEAGYSTPSCTLCLLL